MTKRYKLAELQAMTPADINRLSEKELRRAVADINAVINKRNARLEAAGLEPQGKPYVLKTAGELKSRGELRSQLTAGLIHTQKKTSSVKGYRVLEKQFTEMFEPDKKQKPRSSPRPGKQPSGSRQAAEPGGPLMPPAPTAPTPSASELARKAFGVWDRVAEQNPEYAYLVSKYRIAKEAYNLMREGADEDTAAEEIAARLDEIYSEELAREEDNEQLFTEIFATPEDEDSPFK